MRLSEQYATINRFARRAPVDVEGLVRALGLDLHEAYLDNDISGMLEKNEDGTFTITVNAAHKPNRQRFTIAHELGHYMQHRHLIGSGVDDDRAYRSTSAGKYHNTEVGPREETEANRFAASLLMPARAIDEVRAREGLEAPDELARRFGVSPQAMRIRLGLA